MTAITDWSAFLRRVTDRLLSPAAASGWFANLPMAHEPKSAPQSDLTYAVFVSALAPVQARSGLDATSARLEMTGRIYKLFRTIPEDLIDPAMTGATGALMQAYSSDFELGGEVSNIDLLGAFGTPLSARAGYQTIDKTTFRITDIVIPMIINDAFDQEP